MSIVSILHFFVFVLVVSPVQADPGRNEIRAYLNYKLPSMLELKHFKFKNFRGAQAGTGRTSIAGVLKLKTPTYLRDSNLLVNELKTLGFDGNEIVFYKQIIGMEDGSLYSIYKPEYKSGHELAFTAELRYMDTVQGIRFAGGPHYTKVSGQPSSHLPAEALIYGTIKFKQTVEEFTKAKNAQLDFQDATKKEVERILSGKIFVAKEKGVRKFSIYFDSRFSWTSDPRKPSTLEYATQAVSLWHRDGRWANEHYQRGQKVQMRVKGLVKNVKPDAVRDIGIRLKVPDRKGSGYYDTGKVLQWKGDYFGKYKNHWGNHWEFLPSR